MVFFFLNLVLVENVLPKQVFYWTLKHRKQIKKLNKNRQESVCTFETWRRWSPVRNWSPVYGGLPSDPGSAGQIPANLQETHSNNNGTLTKFWRLSTTNFLLSLLFMEAWGVRKQKLWLSSELTSTSVPIRPLNPEFFIKVQLLIFTIWSVFQRLSEVSFNPETTTLQFWCWREVNPCQKYLYYI